MKLAFTGTRKGMTERQRGIVLQLVEERREKILSAHHGGCLGADLDFHSICLGLALPVVEVWPGHVPSWRARCEETMTTKVITHQVMNTLDRNWEIVHSADLLIACPESPVEQLRSGTWSTVRISSRLNVPCIVVSPYESEEVDRGF